MSSIQPLESHFSFQGRERTAFIGSSSSNAPFPSTSNAIGMLHTTLLPSFTLHSSLAAGTYAIARGTNRMDLKDWLWPSGQVVKSWWSAIGVPMYYSGLSFDAALGRLTWDQVLLLGGVSVWGDRLFHRIASRSIRQGKDDARYEGDKQEPGFWNKAAGIFAAEAAFQSVISLPFTLPFRDAGYAIVPEAWTGVVRGVAVALWGTGMTLEVLADWQIARHREESEDLDKTGVFSIVRHPNYLGDALVHLSFGFLGSLHHPAAMLGPLANYIFLRYVGGDIQNEASQEQRYKQNDQRKYEQLQQWRKEKNSFWPDLAELSNQWTWVVIGAGFLGVALERGLRQVLR